MEWGACEGGGGQGKVRQLQEAEVLLSGNFFILWEMQNYNTV